MSKSLLELTKEIHLLEQQIIEHAESHEGETSERLEKALSEVKENLPNKVDNYYWLISTLEARAENIKINSDKLLKSAKAMESAAKNLKDRIKIAMTELGTPELEGEYFRFKLTQAAPSLVIEDEKAIPNDLQLVQYSPDKKLIKERLLADQEVPGCKLQQNWQLRTYTNILLKK